MTDKDNKQCHQDETLVRAVTLTEVERSVILLWRPEGFG